MKYKDIRKFAKIKKTNYGVFVTYFFRRLSSFFVNIFPNTIIIFMIISEAIGVILFMFPNVWFIIIRYTFIN